MVSRSSNSRLNLRREVLRQRFADDEKFVQANNVYFFELRYPKSAVGTLGPGGQVAHFVPLILNPQSIQVTDLFAHEKIPTSYGGLYVEESGSLEKRLSIRGHTGFRPRLPIPFNPDQSAYPGQVFNVDKAQYAPRGDATTKEKLSGQRHFQFLQDRIFRLYGQLKRNPTYAPKTELIWHNSKDDEHFLIIPESFTLTRDSASRLLYHYNITATVVANATAKLAQAFDLAERVPFTGLINPQATTRLTLDEIRAALKSITGPLATVVKTIQRVRDAVDAALSLVDQIVDIIDAIEDVVTSIIRTPFELFTDLLQTFERLAETVFGLPRRIEAQVKSALARTEAALEHLAFNPTLFGAPGTNAQRKAFYSRAEKIYASRASLIAADASPSYSALDAEARFNEPDPGDLIRSESRLYSSVSAPPASGFSVQTVRRGDTLHSIAAAYLGTSRRWPELAILNGLNPPYISETGLPGTLRVGDTLLVPESVTATADANPEIYVGHPGTSAEVRALGRDLKLVEVAPGVFDLAMAEASDDDDVELIEGTALVIQALRLRLSTELGTDTLFPGLGLAPAIGVGITAVDQEALRLRIRQALVADARVASVPSITLTRSTSGDTIDIEATIALYAISEPVTLSSTLPLPPLYTTP